MKTNVLTARTTARSQAKSGGILQRKCASNNLRRNTDFSSDAVPSIVHEVLSSPGQPLGTATRDFMETRFGHDFSTVRLHTDSRAAESASAINANAFTVGENVVFGSAAGANPAVHSSLLSHELAHVVQQRQAPSNSSPLTVSTDMVAEQQAERVGAQVSSGHTAGDLTRASRSGIQRDEATKPANEELSWWQSALIETAVAPTAMMGETTHDMVKATLRGFVIEVKTQSDVKGPQFWDKVKEALTSPKQAALFVLHYWWGLVKGIFSPITGLFDLGKLLIHLQELQAHIYSTAWSRRNELAGDIANILTQMSSLSDRGREAIQGFKAHPLDTVRALGPWFSSLQKDAIAGAEKGGHKIGGVFMSQLDKPLPELGELAGEIVGTILINIVLLVFTDGIGNAISQVAGKLGQLGSFLGKFGKTAEMFAALVGEMGEVLGTIGGWISKGEAVFAKAAETVLKPLAPLLEELGKVMNGLRSFLRRLLGVSEEAAAGATEQLGAATARQLEPKAPAPKAPTVTKTAPKPDVTPKAPTSIPEPKPTASTGTSAATKNVSEAAEEGKVIDLAARRQQAAAKVRAARQVRKQKMAVGAENQPPVAAYTEDEEEFADFITEQTKDPSQGDPFDPGELAPENVRKTGTVRRTGEYDPWVGDSGELGRRMKAVGMELPGPGYEAHHMVPSNEPSAARLREFLKRRGFTDINHPDNGVWLPRGSQTGNIGGEFKHEFTFDDDAFAGEYFKRMEDILMRDPKITPGRIHEKLRSIREFLKNGQLPPRNL